MSHLKKREAMKFIFGTLGHFKVLFAQLLKRIWPCVPKGLNVMIRVHRKTLTAYLQTGILSIASLLQTLFLTMPRNNNEFEFLI